MNSSFFFTSLLILSIISTCISEPEFTSDIIGKEDLLNEISKCPVGSTDTELSLCFTNFIKTLGPALVSGIPELGLPSVDPFRLDTLTYTINLWPIVPKVIFSNIIIRHLSKFDIGSIHIDTKAKLMSCDLGASFLTAEADYAVDGNMAFLRVIGAGPCAVEVVGGKAIGQWKLRIDEDPKSGSKVLQLDDFKLDLDYENAKLQIGGIFSKIPTWNRIGPLLNRLTNDYHKELYTIIKPEFIHGMVIPVVTKMVNEFLAHMPELVKYFEN